MEGPTKSAEDYLACILELLEQKGYARIADVARHRSVAEASASTMIKRLATQGYLNRENYRGFTLTDTGRTIAIEVHSRRKILTRFLRSLGLPQNVITHDVDGLEHCVSRETVERLSAASTALTLAGGVNTESFWSVNAVVSFPVGIPKWDKVELSGTPASHVRHLS